MSTGISNSKFETVGMIPKSYFDNESVIYGFTERIIDGDTIRVRHIPNYILRRYLLRPFHPISYTTMMTPLQQRSIAQETLSIRLYGVDCPEIVKPYGKRGNHNHPNNQPFGMEAKEFTSQLCHHQIVKITLLKKDQYHRAVAKVEVVVTSTTGSTKTTTILSRFVPRRMKKQKQQRSVDIAMELARAGMAELYTSGGAVYHTEYTNFIAAIHDAQRHRRGIWSLDTNHYQSAADYKKEQRQQQKDTTNSNNHKTKKNHRMMGGLVVDAVSTTTTKKPGRSTTKKPNKTNVPPNTKRTSSSTAAVVNYNHNRHHTTSNNNKKNNNNIETMKLIRMKKTSSTLSDLQDTDRGTGGTTTTSSSMNYNRRRLPPTSTTTTTSNSNSDGRPRHSRNTTNGTSRHHRHHHDATTMPPTTSVPKRHMSVLETAMTGLEIMG